MNFANVLGSIGEGWINSNHAKPENNITAGQYDKLLEFSKDISLIILTLFNFERISSTAVQGLRKPHMLPNKADAKVKPIQKKTQNDIGKNSSKDLDYL